VAEGLNAGAERRAFVLLGGSPVAAGLSTGGSVGHAASAVREVTTALREAAV
jgi:hypothetical protein